MRELTLKKLIEAAPFEVLDTGVVNEPALHSAPVRWAAIRGGIEDWTIYYLEEGATIEQILDHGSKVTIANLILNLVPCKEEVLNKYRL